MRVELAAAVTVDLILAGALARPLLAPEPVPVVHPVAPPLTRIDALGDRVIGGDAPPPSPGWRLALERTVRATGTPAQKAELDALRPPPPPRTDLRAAVQGDAVAMAEVLGPLRVAEIVAEKEALAAWVGEGRVWEELAR